MKVYLEPDRKKENKESVYFCTVADFYQNAYFWKNSHPHLNFLNIHMKLQSLILQDLLLS